MDSDLLQIVLCPKDGQPLREASTLELEALNLRICSGALLSHSGRIVRQPLKAALVRKDGLIAYPVYDNIPFLVAEEAIAIGFLHCVSSPSPCQTRDDA